MTVCMYSTVLNKPCGRQAVRRIRWQQQHRIVQEIHDWPLCPFHGDLQLAELLLSCDVHSIAVLTLDGGLILPAHLQPESPLWPVATPGVAELLQMVNARRGSTTAPTRRTA
jgi:hypothetical protein